MQNSQQQVTTTLNGDITIPPLTTATPIIEEGLVWDEQTNEVYLPITPEKIARNALCASGF